MSYRPKEALSGSPERFQERNPSNKGVLNLEQRVAVTLFKRDYRLKLIEAL